MATLCFDLDGTLADWPFGKAVIHPLREHATPTLKEAIRQEYLHRFASSEPVRAFDWDGIHDAVTTRLGLPSLPRLMDLAAQAVCDDGSLYPDVVPTLQTLRAHGHQLVMATNGYVQYQQWVIKELAKNNPGLFFDAWITPDLVGFCKPQAGFLKSLPHVLANPDALKDAWHVGDLLSQDVVAANRAGVKAAWLWREMPQEFKTLPVMQRHTHQDLQDTMAKHFLLERKKDGALQEPAQELTQEPKPDVVIADLEEFVLVLATNQH